MLPLSRESEGSLRPFLSFSILAFNERATVASMARCSSSILESCKRTYELVLIDDGSTDGTGQLIESLADELPHCRTIHHPRNLGIGAGLQTAFLFTRGEWATCFPADWQVDPCELPRLLGALADCDVLVTYRDARRRRAPVSRKLLSRVDRALVRWLFGIALKDLHWIRFFRRGLLERMQLRCRSCCVDTEMMVWAKKLGARVRQVQLLDQPRSAGSSKGASLKSILTSTGDLLRLWLQGSTRKSRQGHDSQNLARQSENWDHVSRATMEI